MDDIQTLLYIVIGLIYFLSRSFGKKKKNQKKQEQQSPEQQEQKSGKRPLTFEELLEEFTKESSQEKEEPSELETVDEEELPQKQSSYKSIEEIDDEIEEPGKRRFADDESRRIYEESVKGAKSYEKAGSFSDNIGKSRFAEYSTEEEDGQNEVAREIKDMLQDSHDAKKAIILSEILNRKY